jgi:hypothetical protein
MDVGQLQYEKDHIHTYDLYYINPERANERLD